MRTARSWRPSTFVLLIAIVVGLPATHALIASAASNGNDAGTNADASDLKAAPTVLPRGYGFYEGNLSSKDGGDWYAVASPSAGPTCVESVSTATNYDLSTLSVNTGAGTRTVQRGSPQSVPLKLAIATNSVSQATFGIESAPNQPHQGDPARPGYYNFTMRARSAADFPSDALSGRDAPSGAQNAVTAPAGCFGGKFSTAVVGILDDVDNYTFSAKAGQQVFYSFAYPGDPGVLTLTLYDAAGRAVGPAITSNQMASVNVPTDGPFYLTAASASVYEKEYLIGLILGPDDPPGSGCRPYCLVVN